MTDRIRPRAALTALALLGAQLFLPSTSRGGDAELATLLAASDLFAQAPEEFRSELEIRRLDSTAGSRLEIFRKGRDLELVRFLAPRERGKFLLQIGERLYFLAPGSARPVELAPTYRVHGAAIHDLLGLDLAHDFRIESSDEAGTIVTFDLVATTPSAAAKRLRWVVDRTTSRPLRADLQSSQGKVLRVLEFKEWRDAARGVPGLLIVKDVVAGGAPLEIRFLAFEPRAVEAALFDLEDETARAKLLSGR